MGIKQTINETKSVVQSADPVWKLWDDLATAGSRLTAVEKYSAEDEVGVEWTTKFVAGTKEEGTELAGIYRRELSNLQAMLSESDS